MPTDKPVEFPLRINRYLASCGLGSRRRVEELISGGSVTVDDVVETSLARRIDVGMKVCVDGVPVRPTRSVYIVMNKPQGVLSAATDSRERTVIDMLPPEIRDLRPYPIGRLDKESEGLLVITNDGAFAQELIHPSSCIPRIYHVRLAKKLTEKDVVKWRRGAIISEEKKLAKPLDVSLLEIYPVGVWIEIVLGEGFKREIRLLAQYFENKVITLKRIGLGKLRLKNLPLGEYIEIDGIKLATMIREGGSV